MSYPPLPSNGETSWGTKFTTWADAIESRKAEGTGLALRRDTTVGTRVFLDYPGGNIMLHGDTSWRNISELLTNGWTGTLRVRRVNSTVSWAGSLIMPASGITVSSSIPSGFRKTGNYMSFLGRNPSSGDIGALTVTSAFAWGGTQAEGQEIRFEGSYLTDFAWPTSLPGTP